MSGCPLLAALRYAAFSSSAPNRPPLALRVVACREAIRAGHGGCRPGHSLPLAPGLRVTSAGPAHCAGPRQATPAGPAGTPSTDPAGRPADRRERKTKHPTAPPGHLVPLAWPGGEQTVRVLPWPRPSRPVDTKSMCPLSVLPSPRAPHPS